MREKDSDHVLKTTPYISTKLFMEGSCRQNRRPVSADGGRADADVIDKARYQQ